MPVSYGEAVAWPPRRRVARFGSSVFGGGTAAMVVFERQIRLSAARSASDAARVRRLTDHAGHESAGLLRRSWLADAPRAGRFRRFDDRHQHCFQNKMRPAVAGTVASGTGRHGVRPVKKSRDLRWSRSRARLS